jgi:hypothetical protein
MRLTISLIAPSHPVLDGFKVVRVFPYAHLDGWYRIYVAAPSLLSGK